MVLRCNCISLLNIFMHFYCSRLSLLQYSSEPDACWFIMRLRSCIALTRSLSSVWPLNCFLEAGDFGQEDKGNGMKDSAWLSISVFFCEAGGVYWQWRGTFTETEKRAGCSRSGDAGSIFQTHFTPLSALSAATKQTAGGFKVSSHTVDSLWKYRLYKVRVLQNRWKSVQ